MLVLTRSLGERLIINDGEITISVLEIKGNQVRVGIEAPRHIGIHREEVFKRINSNTEGQPTKIRPAHKKHKVPETESEAA